MAVGVCWYPEQWDESLWRGDAAAMRDMGLRVVRLGEFAWSRLQASRDEWDSDWLRRALDLLHEHGLWAVVGTPTAAPPKWLLDEMPDAAQVTADGARMAHGSRRHTCHAHEGYRRECARVAERLADEFGAHPAVVAWQIDNEYGCHGTALSYSAAARAGFRRWLRAAFEDDIGKLNAAWGCSFWSQTYRDFDSIDLPAPTPGGHNPALLLNFYRYTSASICGFNRLQADIVRRRSPGRDVLHNMMGFVDDFDHFDLSRDLDVAGWDSYPLGFLARFGAARTRAKYLRCGHPDYAAFHHDLYRRCGRGRFWVVEQQPGAVNWAAYNPQPAAGMARLWAWEAVAHGAEVVAFFRWRQAARGQEQMHSGLRRPDDSEAAAAGEARQMAAELRELAAAENPNKAQIAFVVDYASMWMGKIQPHGDFGPAQVLLQYYSALRRHGVDIDVVGIGDEVSGYKLVVAPLVITAAAGFARRIGDFVGGGGVALFGARSGSRDEDFAIPSRMPPGGLGDLLGLRVVGVDSMPASAGDEEQADDYGASPQVCRWREEVALCGARRVAPYDDLYAHDYGVGRAYYFAARGNVTLMHKVVGAALRCAGVDVLALPPHLRARRRGDWLFLFNYGGSEATVNIAHRGVVLSPWHSPATAREVGGGDDNNRVCIPPTDMVALRV